MNDKNKPIDGRVVLLGEENSGRDEMNLAGNPFALLQPSSRAGQTSILNEWERTLPNGKVVKASWNVKGDPQLGLPGPNEELLFLVLLELTREAAGGAPSSEWPQRVEFSRYDVLERMKLSDRGRDYKKLEEAFFRLQAVTIQAQNSFYDARTKAPHKAIAFQILNEVALNDEPKGKKGQMHIPLSWFEWNKTVHESFLAGNVRSLALEFVLSLELAISRRLFRFLDMMRGATTPPRREFSIGVMKLRDRLAMQNYPYASKVKQVLQPAIDELISRNYLHSVEYEKGRVGELAIFTFESTKAHSGNDTEAKPVKAVPKTAQQEKIEPESEQSDIRADAVKCYEVFKSLPEAEKAELLTIARKDVVPAFWDRLEAPESPMSLGLWQLVAQKYPEKVK